MRRAKPVGWGVAGPGDLPASHQQLVAQDGDLSVLRVRGRAEAEQTQNPPNNQESQCVHHHHHDDSATQQPSWSPQVTEKLHPTRDEDVRATLALGQTFVHAG